MERGFGVEIECHARMSMAELALRMKQFFDDNMLFHSIHVTDYRSHTDGSNTTVWYIKPDSTVFPQNTRLARKYPHNMEIVSPVLRGAEGMKALRVVCKALDGQATASRSCGLHVHFGMEEESHSNLRNLCNRWAMDEKYFFYPLPDSRLNNEFCRKWRDKITDPKWRGTENLHDFVKKFGSNYHQARRVSLNMKSMHKRNTIELRLHSGTVEWPKISNWIYFTKRWVEKALISGEGSITFKDFIEDMKSDEIRVVNDTAVESLFRRPSPDSYTNPLAVDHQMSIPLQMKSTWKAAYIHPDAKKQRVPSPTTKMGLFVTLLQQHWMSKLEIKREFDMQFGLMELGKQKKLVSGMLTNTKNMKHGFGLNIVQRGTRRYREFRLLPIGAVLNPDQTSWRLAGDIAVEAIIDDVQTEDNVQTEEEVITTPLTDEEKESIDFFIKRSLLFEGRRRPENLIDFSDTELYEELA